MKKIVSLIIGTVIACSAAFAQSNEFFKLTPNGFTAIDDKPYCVVQVDGTATEIYNKVLRSIGRLYNSPQTVASKVENQQISINAIRPHVTEYKFNGKTYIDAHYTLTIEFKDGRVRIFAPNIQKLADCRTDNEILFICAKLNPMTQIKDQSIYNYKDQSLRSPELKSNIENSFNELIETLLFSQFEDNVDEDW